MIKILSLIGVSLTLGSISYAAVVDTAPSEADYSAKQEMYENVERLVEIDNKYRTQQQAGIFSEKVKEVTKQTQERELDNDTVEQIRKTLNVQFTVAFESIRALEKATSLTETEAARESMQIAIEAYMTLEHGQHPKLQQDLDAYSRALTESLIYLSAKNAAL